MSKFLIFFPSLSVPWLKGAYVFGKVIVTDFNKGNLLY